MSRPKKKKNTRMPADEWQAQRRARQEEQVKQSRKALWLIVAFVACIVALLATMFAFFDRGTLEPVTAEQYAQLETGMSYDSAVEIMGRKGDRDGKNSAGDQIYTWENKDGTSASVSVRDNEVTTVSQDGLVD